MWQIEKLSVNGCDNIVMRTVDSRVADFYICSALAVFRYCGSAAWICTEVIGLVFTT